MTNRPGTATDSRTEFERAAYRSAPTRGALAWIRALRAPFLSVSVLPVAIGTFLAARETGHWSGIALALATLATAAVHLASNVGNDLVDDASGADHGNDERIAPFTGGSQVLQDGSLARDDLSRLARGLLLVAAVAGLVLAARYGAAVLAWGIAGIALGAMYTSPWMRLAYRGLGEATIAVAFGLLPVCGAYWLQAGTVPGGIVLLSLAPGCWSCCVLLVNEVPDRRADRRAGKRTLAVRLGARGVALLQLALHLTALLAVAGASTTLALPAWTLPALTPLPLAAVWVARALATRESDRRGLRRAILSTLAAGTWGSLALLAAALAP